MYVQFNLKLLATELLYSMYVCILKTESKIAIFITPDFQKSNQTKEMNLYGFIKKLKSKYYTIE